MVEFTNLISSMLVTIDTSGDGFVDYNELLAAAEEEPVSAQRPRWRASEVLTHSVFAVQQMLLDAIAAVLPAPLAPHSAVLACAARAAPPHRRCFGLHPLPSSLSAWGTRRCTPPEG